MASLLDGFKQFKGTGTKLVESAGTVKPVQDFLDLFEPGELDAIAQSERESVPTIPDLMRSGRALTEAFGEYIAGEDDLSTPLTPRQRQDTQSLIKTVNYPMRQIARAPSAIEGAIAELVGSEPLATSEIKQRAMAGEKIARPPASAILKGAATGFLAPERTPSLMERVPFTKWEQSGSIARLLPRAIAQGAITYGTFGFVYGKPIQAIRKSYGDAKVNAAIEEVQSAVEKNYEQVLKSNPKVAAAMQGVEREAGVQLVTQGILNEPQIGDVLMGRQSAANVVKRSVGRLATETGAVGKPGSFSQRMAQAKDADEGRKIISQYEQAFQDIEKSVGLTPTVGRGGSGIGGRGFSTVNKNELKSIIKKVSTKDPKKGQQLQALIEDIRATDPHWSRLLSEEQDRYMRTGSFIKSPEPAPKPVDFSNSFPSPRPEAIKEGVAERDIGENFDDPEALSAWHREVESESRGILQSLKDMDAEIDRLQQDPKLAKRRKALVTTRNELSERLDSYMAQYANLFGEEVGDQFRTFLGVPTSEFAPAPTEPILPHEASLDDLRQLLRENSVVESKEFQDWLERFVGKRSLDELRPEHVTKIVTILQSGELPPAPGEAFEVDPEARSAFANTPEGQKLQELLREELSIQELDAPLDVDQRRLLEIGNEIAKLEGNYTLFEQEYLSGKHPKAPEEQEAELFVQHQAEALTDKDTLSALNAMDAGEKIELDELMAEMEKNPSNNLFLAIKKVGGIKSYAKGKEAEELRGIPLHLRNNRTGQTPDEIIGELRNFGWHFDSAAELMDKIKEITTTVYVGGSTKFRRSPRARTHAIRLGAKVKPKEPFAIKGAPYTPLPELATPAQIALAHILAKKKGLGPVQFARIKRIYGGGKSTMKQPSSKGEKAKLIEKGMPEDEAARAAKPLAEARRARAVESGQASEPMTKAEAAEVIKAIEQIVVPASGDPGQPRLPRGTTLADAEYFNREFRAIPFQSKFLSSPSEVFRYANVPEFNVLIDAFRMARENVNRRMDELIDYQKLLGIRAPQALIEKGISAITGQTFSGPIRQQSEKLFHAANTDPSMWKSMGIVLTPKEEQVLQAFKISADGYADRLDELLGSQGKPLVNRRQNYIPNLLTETAKLIIEESKPFPEELKAVLDVATPTQKFDPFLLRREGGLPIQTDFWKAWRVMIAIHEKKLALDPALRAVNDYLKVWMTPSATESRLPVSVIRYTKRLMARLMGRPHEWDEQLATTFQNLFNAIPGMMKTITVEVPPDIQSAQRELKLVVPRIKVLPSSVRNASGFLKAISYAHNLAFSVPFYLLNRTQPVTAFARMKGGFWKALDANYYGLIRAYADILRPSKWRYWREQGVLSGAETLVSEEFGYHNKVLQVSATISEFLNRVQTTYMKVRNLKQVEQIHGQEAIRLSKQFSDEVNFLWGIEQAPEAYSSAIGNLYYQYLTFPLKHAELLASLARDLKVKDMLPDFYAAARTGKAGAFFKTLKNEDRGALLRWLMYASGLAALLAPLGADVWDELLRGWMPRQIEGLTRMLQGVSEGDDFKIYNSIADVMLPPSLSSLIRGAEKGTGLLLEGALGDLYAQTEVAPGGRQLGRLQKAMSEGDWQQFFWGSRAAQDASAGGETSFDLGEDFGFETEGAAPVNLLEDYGF